jgi:hypothetical protein
MTVPTPNPAPAPVAPQAYAMPKKKSGGCGCCLLGCFGSIAVLIIALVAGYFVLRNSPDILLSDTVVQWTYTNYARPKIEQFLPTTMTPAEKQRALSIGDQSLKDYLALSDEQKSVLRKEAMTALTYYSQGQVIPHDKIPNLILFIKKQEQAYEQFNPTPRLTQ